MNILTFTTRFGQDAQMRYAQAGKPVASVRCPVESGWGDNKHVSWVTVIIFGERGEKLAPHMIKGKPATITGELRLREFEHNGEKRFAAELILRDIELQGELAQGGRQSRSAPGQADRYQNYDSAPTAGLADDFDDDSIPF